ncbi:ester cyclase [Flavisolibacter ginsenosidimutans]|uniref:Nuclear transport factor 2 family protein n=1 Tax=Flavisolibacter ginsenosidimutans TaxID=661481 RepID=A0A5B8UMH4_9BACT|nr:nuclear transport factor 2 family protein [Flavisolibacter ginsenosidimutans]QEC57399.1 nuclear transport factor 2 family protein [Flavisolibacter ginsenosidimutans]
MEETMLRSEALTLAQKNLLDYFQTHDVKYLADDAVFRNMNTGETYKGRAEIGAMLHFFYHVLFEAKAELVNYAVTEEKAVAEARVKGKHTGNYNGIAATGKEVDFPLCLTYYLKDGLIQEAHIYTSTDVLMQQLGVSASKQKATYLVRDIFHLKFGQFKTAKALLQEAMDKGLMPDNAQARVFSDFTGDAYRLIFEEGFNSLTDCEAALTGGMKAEEWQAWYEQFKPLVERSHREILKQVI